MSLGSTLVEGWCYLVNSKSGVENDKYWFALEESELVISQKKGGGGSKIASIEISGYDGFKRLVASDEILLFKHIDDDVMDVRFSPLNKSTLELWLSTIQHQVEPACKHRKMHLPPGVVKVLGKMTARLDLCELHLTHIEGMSREIKRDLVQKTHSFERPSLLKSKNSALASINNARDILHLDVDIEKNLTEQLRKMEVAVKKAWERTYSYTLSIGQSEVDQVIRDWSQIAERVETESRTCLLAVEKKNIKNTKALADLLHEGDVNLDIDRGVAEKSDVLNHIKNTLESLVKGLVEVHTYTKDISSIEAQEASLLNSIESMKREDLVGVEDEQKKREQILQGLQKSTRLIDSEIEQRKAEELEAFTNELGRRMTLVAYGEMDNISIFDDKNEEQFKTWYESVYNHAYDTKALMSHADDSTDSDESTSTSGSDSRCDEGMEEGET
jgi:hypothetical protein